MKRRPLRERDMTLTQMKRRLLREIEVVPLTLNKGRELNERGTIGAAL